MEEDETNENETPVNTGEGDKPQESSLLERTNAAAERLERANKERNALLDREELARAERALDGVSDAGQGQVKKETEDEKWAREAKERYAGTGYDPTE